MDEDVLSDVERGEENQPVDKEEQVSHLNQEIVVQGLSLLCKIGNGLRHAFVKLDIKEKQLKDIASISSYVHLRFLDLSNNLLTDLSPLASLTQLLWLKIDNNSVKSFKGQPFAKLTYLQWLSMAGNQLSNTDDLVGTSLETLNLTGNSIQILNGLHVGSFANLLTLELRGNQLETTDGINLPNLQKLYLAQNVIKQLEGLDKLERLTTLHLRDNQLDSLGGLSPNMKCLQYLNVRGNLILDENGLQALGNVSKTLQVLIISENPLAESIEYRERILIFIPKLERIDKDLVSFEERAEAWEKIKEMKEEEMKRL